MGFAVSYIAIKNTQPEQLLANLKLKRTGIKEEFPDSYERYYGMLLASGWYLIFINDVTDPMTQPNELAKLSQHSQLLCVLIEEHAMVSAIYSFKNAKQEWLVVHESDQGIDHLMTEGELPQQFHELLAKTQKQQQEENDCGDFFSIPPLLAKSFIGYSYDECLPNEAEKPFEVLKPQTLADKIIGLFKK